MWESIFIKSIGSVLQRILNIAIPAYRERLKFRTDWKQPRNSAPLFFPFDVLYVKVFKLKGDPVRIDRIFLRFGKIRLEPKPKKDTSDPDDLPTLPWIVEPTNPIEFCVSHLWEVGKYMRQEGVSKAEIFMRIEIVDTDERIYKSSQISFKPELFIDWAEHRFQVEAGNGKLVKYIKEWWN